MERDGEVGISYYSMYLEEVISCCSSWLLKWHINLNLPACLKRIGKKQVWEKGWNIPCNLFRASGFHSGEWKKTSSYVWFAFWYQEFCFWRIEEKGSSAGTHNWRGICLERIAKKYHSCLLCRVCSQRLMRGCRSTSLAQVIYVIVGYKHICHSKVYLGVSSLTDRTVTTYNPTMPLPTGYESVLFISTLLPARITFLCYFSASLTTAGCNTNRWRSSF